MWTVIWMTLNDPGSKKWMAKKLMDRPVWCMTVYFGPLRPHTVYTTCLDRSDAVLQVCGLIILSMSKDRSSLWMQTSQSFINFYFSEGHFMYSMVYTGVNTKLTDSIYKRLCLIDSLYSVNNCMLWNKPINFSIFHFKPNINRFHRTHLARFSCASS